MLGIKRKVPRLKTTQVGAFFGEQMFEQLLLPNGGKKLHPSNVCSNLQLGQSLAFKVYRCGIPRPCHRANSSDRLRGVIAKILRCFIKIWKARQVRN